MKKLLIIISFFGFMFSLGTTIKYYKEINNITIVEYNFYAKENEKGKQYKINYNDIEDNRLKEIVKKEKEADDCSFDDIGLPKCVSKIRNDSMKYEKYYIVYYGDNYYKVIYKVADIKYLDKIINN